MEESKEWADYSLEELQEVLDDLYAEHKNVTDKSLRKQVKKNYKELAMIYNKRVKFEAYKVDL